MRITTAHRIAPQIPAVLGAMVGTIVERTVRDEFPELSQFECLRSARELMRAMDAQTAVEILCAEGKVASC